VLERRRKIKVQPLLAVHISERRDSVKNLSNDISQILVTADELQAINKRLGEQITKDFKDKNLLVIGILKGSIYFMADLTRYIDLPLKLDFLAVSSYGGGTRSSGAVKIVKDIDINLEGYDILLVEDILDSGRTLDYVSKMLGARGAKSISIATLLDKPDRRVVELTPDYVGCDVPDEFVVGYGLDYDQKYRNLPYIGALSREIYE
jgi:hypoxanthine phosphoribosyltransferase